jgi:hypothetical protein
MTYYLENLPSKQVARANYSPHRLYCKLIILMGFFYCVVDFLSATTATTICGLRGWGRKMQQAWQ